MSGSLILVPTTLGDPKGEAGSIGASLPATAIEHLRSLRHFAVESAKPARAFLKAVGMPVPIAELAIHEIGHAPDVRRLAIALEWLGQGHAVGLLSEAGSPAVADPGASLVRRAHELGIPVRPLVGPSALLRALMASGLEGQRFAFAGYLPAKSGARETAIRELESRSRKCTETQIAIETPYRNQALFAALLATLSPSTRLSVAADLTLATETIATRRVADWRALPLPALGGRPAVFLFLAD